MVSVSLVHRAMAPLFARGFAPRQARLWFLATLTALFVLCIGVTPALAASESYQVQHGDTLSGIALRFGVSVARLQVLNGIANPDRIAVGQTLRLADAAPAPAKTAAPATVRVSARSSSVISAPYYNQFDGSIYAESNCGPTALAMALGALDLRANQIELRHLAARQMGFDNPHGGTTWESLAYAARVNGIATKGIVGYRRYTAWSIDDLQREFAQGHPVLLLVRYRVLPGHTTSSYWGDHYIVGLGFDQTGNLIYHDPAYRDGPGAYLKLSRGQLLEAWGHTAIGYVRTALALSK